MITDLHISAMARALAHHAASRQALISENVANADTVGFRARGLPRFEEVYRGPGAPQDAAPEFAPRATRPGHEGFQPSRPLGLEDMAPREIARRGAESPDGNTVSLEDQMVRGAEAKLDHDMALGVMRAVSDILRMAIGRK